MEWDLLDALDELVARGNTDPLNGMRWLRPQDAFLRLDAAEKLYRAGNQALGKTTVGLAEVRYECLGGHPYRADPRGKREVIICSLNQAQSLSTQAKFNDMLPDGCLAKGCEYNVKTGFGANKPMTIFANGSTVKWVTDDQGPRAVAGATVNLVLIDEPCSAEMHRELKKRLMIKRGRLLITMTPINGPTEHFREDVEAGRLAEVHTPLTVDNCRYADTGELRRLEDGTLCDQRWIDAVRAQTHPRWSPIVNDGLWELLPEGVFYSCFEAPKHVSDRVRLVERKDAPVRWVLGIDYAAADRAFGHVGMLCQVQSIRDKDGRPVESIYVVDEVVMDGTTTSYDFVSAVVTMLDRQGIQWRQLHAIHGDNPVTSQWVMKSNLETMKAVALRLGMPLDALHPRIKNAKEGGNSSRMYHGGNQYVFAAIKQRRLMVHPRCERLIKAFETWDYTKDHEAKDVIDALRYALVPWILQHAPIRALDVRVA